MDNVVINITEQIDDISITVVEQATNVDITVTQQTEEVNITATSQVEQVTVTVNQQVEQVTINIVEGVGGGGGAVDSVNGQTGVVVLDTSDIPEATDFNYISDAEKVVVQNTSNTNTGDQDLSGKEDVGVAQGIMDTHEANHPIPTIRDTRNQIAGSYEPLKGADDNYVTDAEKVVIGNTSNTNTGDQDISGIATNAGDILTIQGEQTTQNTAIDLNTAKVSNVSTDLSEGTTTETTVDVNSSDGTNATLVAASTLRAGVLTKAKFDEIEVNNAKTGITAQQSSDITTNNAKNTYPTADATKLSGIEALAEVNNISDVNATALTDAGETALHSHAAVSSPQPYIQLRRGGAPSTVSTVSGSTSAITWSIETHKDSEFTHDTVTNSEQIQVNETGVYRLQWAIGFAYASSSSSYFRCQPVYRWSILLSVNNFYGSKRTQHQFTQKGNISQNVVISLSSGQYIYAAIYIENSPVSGTMPLTNTECELTLTKID